MYAGLLDSEALYIPAPAGASPVSSSWALTLRRGVGGTDAVDARLYERLLCRTPVFAGALSISKSAPSAAAVAAQCKV